MEKETKAKKTEKTPEVKTYKVISIFKDTDGTVYKPGDVYPKDKATEKRIKQLSTKDNKYKKPFIK